jgi:uncharacterized protein (TIGR00369 family)
MPPGRDLLDRIVAGSADPAPPFVGTLRLPRIQGWETGRVWSDWQVDPAFFHERHAVFGGYVAAIADSLLGLATLSVLEDGELFSTSDLRVSFFRPVTGGTLRCEAHVIHRGRRMAHVEATFTRTDGKIAAKATATQVIAPVVPA